MKNIKNVLRYYNNKIKFFIISKVLKKRNIILKLKRILLSLSARSFLPNELILLDVERKLKIIKLYFIKTFNEIRSKRDFTIILKPNFKDTIINKLLETPSPIDCAIRIVKYY